MIESTKQEVENKYNVSNGYDHDAMVSCFFFYLIFIINQTRGNLKCCGTPGKKHYFFK